MKKGFTQQHFSMFMNGLSDTSSVGKNSGNLFSRKSGAKKGIYPAPLYPKSGAGFTLIELMIVMVIMGILISVGLASYRSVQRKSRDGRRKSDLRQIASALELYFNDKGGYPGDDGNGNIKGCGVNATGICTWGSIMKDDTKGTVYMVTLPGDPASGAQYYYDSYGGQGKGFQLYARLENPQDIDLKRDGSGNVYYYVNTVCYGTKKCNYGVASSDLALDDASQGHTLTTTD